MSFQRRSAVVVLVVALVGGTGLSASPASAATEREVTLNALFYTEGADGPSGGTNKFTVHYETTGEKQFRVAFSEDEVGGTGDQWESAGWNAATVATLLTGSALRGTEVRFDVNGRIDGPSAGALMTVGLLSLIRGEKLKKDITMTGTINPDGTVGPVGGIPYKVDGVVKAKKARMLIPVGQRNSADADGNLVDVVALGRTEGVEVKEVATVYDAYKAFTGKTLPRPASASVELPSDTYDELSSKVKSLQAEYQASVGEFGGVDATIRGYLDSLAIEADESATRAQSLSDNGLQAGAYNAALLSAAYANAAVKTGQALQIYLTQGADAFVSQVKASTAISGKVEAFVDSLKNFKPKTVSDASALVEGYGGAVDAISITNYADNLFDQVDQATTEEDALTNALLGAVFYELAGTLVQGANDVVDVGKGRGGAKLAKNVRLGPIADFFRKAAEANLAAFDTLILEPAANAQGANAEEFKASFASSDIDYALAQSSIGVLEGGLDDYLGDAKTAAYARLGGAVSLYARSAGLLSKYYSLDAQLDDDGNVVGVGNERALVAALDFGADQVERSVGLLASKKVDTPLVVASYEVAGVDREGTADDKLQAVNAYLSAFTEARVLAYIGGFQTAGFGKK